MSLISEIFWRETKREWRERELENGKIKSAASAIFAVFDGAEKEMFWIDNPCLW